MHMTHNQIKRLRKCLEQLTCLNITYTEVAEKCSCKLHVYYYSNPVMGYRIFWGRIILIHAFACFQMSPQVTSLCALGFCLFGQVSLHMSPLTVKLKLKTTLKIAETEISSLQPPSLGQPCCKSIFFPFKSKKSLLNKSWLYFIRVWEQEVCSLTITTKR